MDKAEEKTKFKLPAILKKFKKPSKHMFWAWIAYQCIKGILTTTFIWIPLLYLWFSK